MEIGSIAKSSLVPPVWVDAARTAAPGPARGVPTEIPAREAVTQPVETAGTSGESRRAETTSTENNDRRVVIDSTTHQVVYQTVDGFTGQVVRQTPDQALLRQRAYFIQVEDAKAAAAAAEAAKPDGGATFVERRV